MTIPKIQNAFDGWKTDIILTKVTQSIDGRGIMTETESPNKYQVVIQPLSPEKLKNNSSGKRSWGNWQIHTDIDLKLSTGDRVKYLGKTYEVEAMLDYSLNNYYEYHLLKDYE